MKARLLSPALAVFGALLFRRVAVANNFIVKMVGTSFSPSALSINAGDSVTWTNTGTTTHNSTSTSAAGSWSSPNFGFKGVYTHVFPSGGNFPYECTLHAACCGMVGTITVKAAAAPPSVVLGSPASGSVFSSPASFLLQATAASSAGTIAKVQFFSGTNLLGSVTQPPYSLPVSGLTNGVYSFTAEATDNSNNTGFSAAATVTVTTILLSSPAFNPAGSFQFEFEGNVAGKTNIIQVSTNLPNWTAIGTNTGAGTLFKDPTAPGVLPRFYRAVELP